MHKGEGLNRRTLPHGVLGPVWPLVGPDYNEPLERFRVDFLARECRASPRVRDWLALRERTSPAAVNRRLEELEADLRRERARRQVFETRVRSFQGELRALKAEVENQVAAERRGLFSGGIPL